MPINELDDLHSLELTDINAPENSDIVDEPEVTDGVVIPTDNDGDDGALGVQRVQTDAEATAENDNGGEGEDGSNDKNIKGDLSGVEQYLAQFDIEGGMIDFQDGTKEHFNNLTPEKQLDVLTKLHSISSKSVEDRYGLDEEEINLINYMRQQEGTIDQVIDNLAQQRAQVYIAAQTIGNTNINDMDADAVYTAFLIKSNPEATAEQLENDLETAKKMSNYDKVVASIKDSMVKEQKDQIEKSRQESTDAMVQEIENQRKEVVSVVSAMNDVDGLTINDGIKNDVLDLILNIDEDGDSLFMTQVFSDPKELFRAAFWYKNGLDILKSREEYWKKEKSQAYKRGQTDAANGKKSFSASDVDGKNTTTPTPGNYDEIVSLDDIHGI